MKKLLLLVAMILPFIASAQIDAHMFKYPDVSQTQITFSYGGDVWIVEKTGGVAHKISSPQGTEIMPRFSPDGKTIAFTGNYDGNNDIYTVSNDGGIPTRLTWHGYTDKVIDWHPNGTQILFASTRKSGKARFSQFYLIDADGGLPTKLPMAHAEYGSLSADGKMIAFTDKSRLSRTWKRYRGGTAPDIWLMNLETLEAEKVAQNDANDELPMIHGDEIYFSSDRGEHMRHNLWSYNMKTKATKQLTFFENDDIQFPAIGTDDIVFEAGGQLYLYSITTGELLEVNVQVYNDFIALQPKTVNLKNDKANVSISHDGNRVVVEARGEMFSVPVKDGSTINLSQTSGVAERTPAWSPNGKYVAYWSDASGEYQLELRDMESGDVKILTDFDSGFRYQLYWSPDSKKIAFISHDKSIQILMVETKELIKVDDLLFANHYVLDNFKAEWDKNSQWLAYSKDTERQTSKIVVFDLEKRMSRALTSGFYSDSNPTFSADGKYIFFLTNRHFSPSYSDYDNSFIYDKSTMFGVATLQADETSLLKAKNDVVELVKEEKKEKADDDKSEKKGKKKDKKNKSESEDKEKDEPKTEIDFDGFEERVELLPIKAGDYSQLSSVDGKLLFTKRAEKGSDLMYFDLEKLEEENVISGVWGYELSGNGKKILIRNRSGYSVINPSSGQKAKDMINFGEMQATVVPMEEWKQIFREAWRLERDYFYDKNMHGVDWQGVYDHYIKLIEMCSTRSDVNFVLGEVIGEMNASHTYKSGGDTPRSKRLKVGYLGIDFEADGDHYKVAHIVDGADWDAEARSPLAQSGVDVKEGDYILAINGLSLDTSKEPFVALQGLAGKTVELLVNDKPNTKGARKVYVETMTDEYRLRNLEWINKKRERVDLATNGEVGYIYVPSTGIDGQNELVRQFMGQWDKEALIIDERFNNGGQIPDRFIELLNRKPLAKFAVRDGMDWQWPPVAHNGPKVMMINGWSGSGGDAFPYYFKKSGLGELVGTRTWGGLIGISGVPSLIDGGGITVPTFRMYDGENGDWFPEGYGVVPDVEVDEDAGQLSKGIDPQLEKAIEVIQGKLKTQRYEPKPRPAYENR